MRTDTQIMYVLALDRDGIRPMNTYAGVNPTRAGRNTEHGYNRDCRFLSQ